MTEERKDGVIKFMTLVEKKISVPEDQRCQITNTDTETCDLCLFLVAWWTKQPMRFSFFTILLRCGQQFTGDFPGIGSVLKGVYDFDKASS